MRTQQIEGKGQIALSCQEMHHGGTSFFIRRWKSCSSRSFASIVILHGLGGHSGYYDAFARLLAALQMDVISYDRRGHGYSGGRRGYVRNLNTDSDDLNWLLTTMQPQPTTPTCLLGDSWGALLLLEYSRRYTLNVEAIILSSPPVRLNVRTTWLASTIRALCTLIGTALRGRPAMPAPFPLSYASTDERFLKLLTSDPTTNLRMHPNALTITSRLMLRAKRSAAAIKVPTLILVGSLDRIISTSAAQRLARAMICTVTEVEQFTQAHHTLYLDNATPLVAATIQAWLARVTGHGGGSLHAR